MFSDCLAAFDWLPGIGDVVPGNDRNGFTGSERVEYLEPGTLCT